MAADAFATCAGQTKSAPPAADECKQSLGGTWHMTPLPSKVPLPVVIWTPI